MSISLILDNNGIIQKSKEARSKYGKAKENEQADLEKVSDWIEKQANGNEETTKPIKVAVDEKATSNGTINGEEGNPNNPTIPEGYIPVNTDTSNWGDGNTAPTQDSVDHGLVIKDEHNNEWVWVPVPDVTVICDTTNQTEYTLCGTEGETAVTTNKYSKSEIISKKTRTTPGISTSDSFREPDLVVNSGTQYDASDIYYKTILEFASKEKMAKAFVEDYNEMIASISDYGGFYIGRYELSNAGVQKDKETLTDTNWYNLYKECKELNASEKVETRMIWGCQWDVTMNWLISSGAKTSDEVNSDSSSWGNYYITSVTKLKTGENTSTMANNIYDLAGNCWEWTQEAHTCYYRAFRGGSCNSTGSSCPASIRDGGRNPDDSERVTYIRLSSNLNNKVTF